MHPENHVAIRLYKSFGFEQFATGNGGYLNMAKMFYQNEAEPARPDSVPGDSQQ